MKLSPHAGAAAGVLALAALTLALGAGNAATYPAWHAVCDDLRAPRPDLENLLVVFLVTQAVAILPAGVAVQRFGPRRTLAVVTVGWGAAGVARAAAPNAETFVATVVLHAAFSAAVIPAAVLLLAGRVDGRFRAAANGLVAAAVMAGQAAGLGLTGWLIVALAPATTPHTFTAADFADRSTTRVGELDRDRLARHVRQHANPRFALGYGPGVLTAVSRALVPLLPSENPSADEMAAALNAVVLTPGVFDDAPLETLLGPRSNARSPWERPYAEPQRVMTVRVKPPGERTAAESQWLNRQVLEAVMFPRLPQLRAPGWRPALLVYAALGLAAGLVLWLPWRPTAGGAGPGDGLTAARWLLGRRDSWLYYGLRFCAGYGWACLLVRLVRHVNTTAPFTLTLEYLPAGLAPAFAACSLGCLGGGLVTAWLTRTRGRRWGVAWPLGVSLVAAAGLTAACYGLPEDWLPLAAFAAACVAQGFATPAAWAHAQDAGGPRAGLLAAWGNHAAVLGVLAFHFVPLPWQPAGGPPTFMLGGVSAFVLAGLCGLLLNPDRDPDDDDSA